MSRIGKKIIDMPAGVSAKMENDTLTISGGKGTLSQWVNPIIKVNIDGQKLSFEVAKDVPEASAMHGLYRALAHNMVVGVSEGFSKKLIIRGVGYKVVANGDKVTLNLGYSHPIEVKIPEGISVSVPTSTPTLTEVVISGIDKQKVGQFASDIKDLRPVEPYHGYGVQYSDEVVIRKVGKTAGKGKK